MIRIQYSLRNLLIATTYVAGWFVAWKTGNKYAGIAELIALFFVIALPAWCVGAILGRHLVGILCGAASAATWIAAIIFFLATH